MSSVRHRLEKLEKHHAADEPCPSCRGRIIHEEHDEVGEVTYPQGDEPCLECGNSGGAGVPGVIAVYAPRS